MSTHMNFNEGSWAEVEIDDGEVTLWIRSADRSQVVSWTLSDADRAKLIQSLQAPKQVEE